MTVSDLIYELKNYKGDAEVRIALYQRFGSDFTYEIESIGVCHVSPFWGRDNMPCVQIVMGEQDGTPIKEEYDEDFDSLDYELSADYEDDEEDYEDDEDE